MTALSSAEMLDLIKEEYREDWEVVARAWISGKELSQLQGNIAFYSGSFNPPHYGHLAVMEAALISIADHLMVSVHSHNLGRKLGPHAPLHGRIVMVALTFGGSPLGHRMRLAAPSVLDGIQNPQFDEIASAMISRGAVPWIVMGRDALKPTYRQEMRQLPHLIIDRPPYKNDLSVLTGRVLCIKPMTTWDGLPVPLERALGQGSRKVAILYDARIGRFHDVISLGEDSWPRGNGAVFVLFSEGIEGHDFMSFDIPSYAFLDPALNRWSLSKTPLHAEYTDSSDNSGWIISTK